MKLVPEKSDAYFHCDSVGKVYWQRVNNSLPDSGHVYAPTVYAIDNVEIADGGVYECLGVAKNDELFYAQGVLKILGM